MTNNQSKPVENKGGTPRYIDAIRALTHLYEAVHLRQGWEDGVTESEAIEEAHDVLCEFYGDPYPRKDRQIP